jgi:hypothetical protein
MRLFTNLVGRQCQSVWNGNNQTSIIPFCMQRIMHLYCAAYVHHSVYMVLYSFVLILLIFLLQSVSPFFSLLRSIGKNKNSPFQSSRRPSPRHWINRVVKRIYKVDTYYWRSQTATLWNCGWFSGVINWTFRMARDCRNTIFDRLPKLSRFQFSNFRARHVELSYNEICFRGL